MTGYNNLPGRGVIIGAGGLVTGAGAGLGAQHHTSTAQKDLPQTGPDVGDLALTGSLILLVGVGLVVLAAVGIRVGWTPKAGTR